METDIEDIKKLDAVIKEETDISLRDEFDDFINHTISDDEEPLEGLEEDDLTEIENVIDTIVESPYQNKYHNTSNLNFSSDLNLVKNFLDLEEVKEINSCKDAKLKKLLTLNRAKHVQLLSVRYRLYELLKECKVSLKVLEEKIEKFNTREIGPVKSIIPRLGHPYFKTKDFYSCSPNAETLKKQESNEICIDYLPQLCRWTIEDQVILKRAIIFNYTSDTVNKYEVKLKMLESAKKKATNEAEEESIQKNILEVEKELNKWKENQEPEPPPLDSDFEINWINISRADLNNRHSPHACKAFWNIYLHPAINKSVWCEKENKQIHRLVKKYNLQNWEQIAVDLQTNRSGFAVCVHYYSTLNRKYKRDRFDSEEDEFLVEVVNECRIGNYIPWSKVCHYFENRSRAQLYHRYKYNLEYSNVKRGTFSQAEDVLVAILVGKFGKDFKRCCQYIPNRSPTQVCHRYNNYIMFDKMNMGSWSSEEDNALLEHVRTYGAKDWSKLFPILKTKNRTHIRHRYIYIKTWLSKNPEKKLFEMPRSRKNRWHLNSKTLEIVKQCAEHFKACKEIPTLEEINEQLVKMGQASTVVRPLEIRVRNDNIDKELIEYFQSTCKIRTSKVISPQDLTHIVDVIKILMAALEVELMPPPNDSSIRNNPLLDLLDVEILLALFQNAYDGDDTALALPDGGDLPCSSKSSSLSPASARNTIRFENRNKICCLPPNINTLVGIRSMLLMYQSFKKKQSNDQQLCKLIGAKVPMSQTNTDDIDDEARSQIAEDQEKFIIRFDMIFKWPALMSIMEPNENLTITNLPAKNGPAKTKQPQKVGRPRKDLTKIELMNKARMNNYMNRKSQQNSNTVTVDVDSPDDAMSTLESPDVKVELVENQLKISEPIKRGSKCGLSKRTVKKLKTERSDQNSEVTELKQDIDKLDSALLLELKGSDGY